MLIYDLRETFYVDASDGVLVTVSIIFEKDLKYNDGIICLVWYTLPVTQ